MADTFMLEVVTPGREIVREPVAEAQVPGRSGYFGILPGHTPLLTELGIGALSYQKGGATVYVAVMGGVAEVLPTRVIVLADAAERAEEIDAARAQTDLAEAERKLAASVSHPEEDPQPLLDAVTRARVRVEVAGHGGAASGKS